MCLRYNLFDGNTECLAPHAGVAIAIDLDDRRFHNSLLDQQLKFNRDFIPTLE